MPGISKRQTMSLEAQRKLALDALLNGPKHTYHFRALGCSHPAARVQELIRMGFPIVSSRITATDSDGFTHHGVAMYELLPDKPQRDLFSEPETIQ
ncbi:helix-turn-helix domain-containing protein [Burkholderia pseudomallei]|uniref:helix-turn-helix domain-containing protein n=1 Tax=Burkholderia pseudomallei TaxID=28450 RepID=UPI00016B218A|nr:helix-turn-helix domain-containing protein [Burkholderia pseudomallei]